MVVCPMDMQRRWLMEMELKGKDGVSKDDWKSMWAYTVEIGVPWTEMWKLKDLTWVKAMDINSNACKKQARGKKKKSRLGEGAKTTMGN